jgi:hypothetical protein
VTGQAPLVDFCNLHDPRARPIESPEPRSMAPRPFPRPPVKACAFGSNVGRRLLSSATRTLPKQSPDHDGRPSSEHRHRVARSYVATSSRACARSPAAPSSDPAEVSRVRGLDAFACLTPPAAIARNGSFAPTRSARTPAVVKLAAMPAGEASTAGHTRAFVCPCRAHRASLLARGPPDAGDQLPFGRCSEALRRFSLEFTRLLLIS